MLVMCVLVEASRQNDSSRTREIWDLLSDLYATNSFLSELSEDRRRSHAASLIINAWKAQSKPDSNHHLTKPGFVSALETQVLRDNIRLGPETDPVAGPIIDQDINAMLDFDFQDIDWSFWNSID